MNASRSTMPRSFTLPAPIRAATRRSGWHHWPGFLLGIVVAFASAVANAEEPAAPADAQLLGTVVEPFLTTYCTECHGASEQQAERRFDRIALPVENGSELIRLQEIADILALDEMPPLEAEQPDPGERQKVIDALTRIIDQQRERLAPTAQETVIRRLNHREYRNTIGDLFDLNVTIFDPTESFPRDETQEHLDTVGQRLVTSGFLLNQYLEAADRIVEKVFALDEPPPVKTYRFTDDFKQQPELDRALRDWIDHEFICLYETATSQRHEGAYAKIHGFEQGVPRDGRYQVRVLAEAKNRRHDHPARLVTTNPDEPLRLGIVPGNQRFGDLSRPQPIEPTLAEFELADDEQKWYSATVWIDAGFTPRFTFPNGTISLRRCFGPISKKLAKQSDGKPKNADFGNRRLLTMKHGKLPHIRIHEVEIRGPIYDDWPPAGQRSVLGDQPFAAERTRTLLTGFARRAYRRPPEPIEIDRLMQFVDQRVTSGRSHLETFQDALKRVLCSPSFLYLHEPSDEDGRLTDHALASRLSYFLWSTIPDQELSELADRGVLQQPKILRQQLRRMVDDPRSDALVANFLDSWLALRQLGSQPPDRRAFEVYHARNLKPAMKRETQLFTKHLLDHNLSVMRLIDADFTFLNESLAELYGRKDVRGNEFRKVALKDARRGGVLTHASVLTATANGVDTSPVTRGVWVLENVLGTPPSPPPADVEPLNPDTRGAKSIREQLEKHRESASCYQCHRKIDPYGFALETFDPIGRWRTEYDHGGSVDASATLPDGTRFSDVRGLKEILLTRRPQIARAIASKLLAYGTGRPMQPADRAEIDRLVADLHDRGDGMYDLLQLVVTSEIFRSP